MASCAEGHSLRELLGDELLVDYFDETTNLSSSTSASKTTSNEDLERLISNIENKNTKKTIRTWVNRLNSRRESIKIVQKLHDIPPEELDKILQHFYAELVKSL